MSWIQDNKFLVALGGGTLVGAILLFIVGSQGASRYEAAQENFDAAKAEVEGFERLALYPTIENRDGKQKAIKEYRQAVDELQEAFAPFRTEGLKNTSPLEFTTRLLAVNTEVQAAFKDSGTKAPEAFFCGFGNYKSTQPKGDATGILTYQLAGIRELMLALSNAGASELANLHRPVLPEEDGRQPELDESSVARQLPVEITFKGPEKAVREFLSKLVTSKDHFFVVRSIRVANTKQGPPRASDVKFEETPAAKPSAPKGGGAGFSFDLPTEDGDKAEDGEEKADAPPAEAATTPAPADSSRILAQVLGNEELQVFLRIDLMQFLPAKSLP